MSPSLHGPYLATREYLVERLFTFGSVVEDTIDFRVQASGPFYDFVYKGTYA